MSENYYSSDYMKPYGTQARSKSAQTIESRINAPRWCRVNSFLPRRIISCESGTSCNSITCRRVARGSYLGVVMAKRNNTVPVIQAKLDNYAPILLLLHFKVFFANFKKLKIATE